MSPIVFLLVVMFPIVQINKNQQNYEKIARRHTTHIYLPIYLSTNSSNLHSAHTRFESQQGSFSLLFLTSVVGYWDIILALAKTTSALESFQVLSLPIRH